MFEIKEKALSVTLHESCNSCLWVCAVLVLNKLLCWQSMNLYRCVPWTIRILNWLSSRLLHCFVNVFLIHAIIVWNEVQVLNILEEYLINVYVYFIELVSFMLPHIDGLVQDCSISIANALEILQSSVSAKYVSLPDMSDVCRRLPCNFTMDYIASSEKCLMFHCHISHTLQSCTNPSTWRLCPPSQ